MKLNEKNLKLNTPIDRTLLQWQKHSLSVIKSYINIKLLIVYLLPKS